MIYRVLVLILGFMMPVFGAEFGEYRYSKYIGLQQQIKNQQMTSRRMQARYNASPTRNIRYPTSSNPYPNIQKNKAQNFNAYQRYSPQYYQRTYQQRTD